MQNERSNHGMLLVPLLDKQSDRIIIAATGHLKAKAGAKNDAIRDYQVCLHSYISSMLLVLERPF